MKSSSKLWQIITDSAGNLRRIPNPAGDEVVEPTAPATPEGNGGGAAAVAGPGDAVARERMAGAQTAARVAGQRLRETRARAERREAELTAEVAFLRSQLDQSRTAEEQLRVLLLKTTRALEAATNLREPMRALPMSRESESPRRWWQVWATG